MVAARSTHFIITASADGHVKFWRKAQGEGIEFVKHFGSHLGTGLPCALASFARAERGLTTLRKPAAAGPINSMAVSADGMMLATTSTDKALKIYDVENFGARSWPLLDRRAPACSRPWVVAPRHDQHDPAGV